MPISVLRLNADDPQQRHKLISRANLFFGSLAFAGATLKFVTHSMENAPIPAMVIVLCSGVLAIYLWRGGSARIGGWLLVFNCLFALTLVGYASGGLLGPILILAPLAPLLGIVLVNARSAWVMFCVVTLVVGTMQILHLLDLVPSNDNGPTGILVGRALAIVALSFMVTIVCASFEKVARAQVEDNWYLATHDHLTGLLNRRALDEHWQAEVARAARSGEWLSAALIDVDHFKRFNDANGHQAGDDCLVSIADALNTSLLRPADRAARFGGEEFLVMLPDTDPAGALLVANRIQSSVLGAALPCGWEADSNVSVTIGIGSVRSGSPEALERVVGIADNALYRGKNKGRNCIEQDEVDEPLARWEPDRPTDPETPVGLASLA